MSESNTYKESSPKQVADANGEIIKEIKVAITEADYVSTSLQNDELDIDVLNKVLNSTSESEANEATLIAPDNTPHRNYSKYIGHVLNTEGLDEAQLIAQERLAVLEETGIVSEPSSDKARAEEKVAALDSKLETFAEQNDAKLRAAALAMAALDGVQVNYPGALKIK